MISEKLTFKPIGLESSSVKGRLNLYYFLLLIEIFCPILYAVFTSGYHDGGFLLLGLGAELAGVGATLMWYYLMNKINESVDDSLISQYVKITFGIFLLGNVFSLCNFFKQEEWLETVTLIISLVSLIPYILICVHLISNGDSEVRKFGNLLLYVGIIASGVLTFGLVMVANSDLPERSVWRLMIWVCLLICYLQVLPFRSVFDVIDKKDTIEPAAVEPAHQVAATEPIEPPSKPEPQSEPQPAPQPVPEPAAAPLPQSASSLTPMKAMLIGVGAGLMVCGLVFGGIYIYSNRSQKFEADDDDYMEGDYYTYRDNDRDDSEPVYPVAVASAINEEEQILPSWLPQEVLDAFGKPNLTEKGYEYYKDNLLRVLRTDMEKPVKYHGRINDYDIVVEMTLYYSFEVSGRYAYESTLRNYGDSESSWFKFKGHVLLDEDNYSPYLVLETRNPQTNEIFEYMLLKYTYIEESPFFIWSGRMFNKRYLNEPTQKFYSIEFIPDEDELL